MIWQYCVSYRGNVVGGVGYLLGRTPAQREERGETAQPLSTLRLLLLVPLSHSIAIGGEANMRHPLHFNWLTKT